MFDKSNILKHSIGFDIFTKLWPNLSRDELQIIKNITSTKKMAAGAQVLANDNSAKGIYMVLSGNIATYFRLPGDFATKLDEFAAGSFFNEELLLGDVTQNIYYYATNDTVIGIIERDSLKTLILLYPELCHKITSWVSKSIIKKISTTTINCTQLLHKLQQKNQAKKFSLALKRTNRFIVDNLNFTTCEKLQRTPILSDFTLKEIDDIRAVTTALYVPRNKIIAHASDTGGTCFLLLAGAVQVALPYSSELAKTRVFNPNNFIDAYSLISSNKRSLTLKAREDAKIIEISASALLKLKRNNERAWYMLHNQIVKSLVLHLDSINNQLRRISAYAVNQMGPDWLEKELISPS